MSGERAGFVPSIEWKKRYLHEDWYEGESLMVSIGQGYLLVTPIQILNMISIIANGGKLWIPRIVERVESLDGTIVLENPSELKNSLDVSPSTFQTIRAALRDVVMTGSGTGTRARLNGLEVAGKTGTAQVIRIGRERKTNETIPREQRDHAWFTCYAPAQDPEIAVVVLVEHGGHGGESAAPIAREILRAYFSSKNPVEGERTIAQSFSWGTSEEDKTFRFP
jgi:penicillin-binding protein 2